MQAYISVAVCLIGLVVYLASQPGKIQELSKDMFRFGLLAWLLQVGSQVIGR